VAGVVFFAVRALLALFPALTVSFPIKKWSAAAALVAAAFYLLLSGAEVATQRSFFMTAVVLIAVMVDRRAVTFRTLAVAAMIVLAIAPEALVHPSFQMSFAATLGLVARCRSACRICLPRRTIPLPPGWRCGAGASSPCCCWRHSSLAWRPRLTPPSTSIASRPMACSPISRRCRWSRRW
jgi:predicted membrane metal-binding protein